MTPDGRSRTAPNGGPPPTHRLTYRRAAQTSGRSRTGRSWAVQRRFGLASLACLAVALLLLLLLLLLMSPYWSAVLGPRASGPAAAIVAGVVLLSAAGLASGLLGLDTDYRTGMAQGGFVANGVLLLGILWLVVR